MDRAAIEERLRLGEDGVTEFKGVARNGYKMDAGDLAKAIVALANSRGGHVLLGIEDDGTASGTGDRAQTDALMRQVSQVCADKIHPAIACSVTKVALGEVTALVVEVPAFSADRPYRADKVYYIRDGNRAREASREEMARLFQSVDHHYDEQPAPGGAATDLDELTVRSLLARLYPPGVPPAQVQRYLRAIKCVGDDGLPTVTGVLFFGTEPGRSLPDARITAIRFPGTKMSSEFIDRQEIGGRLLDQIEGTLSFLQRHLIMPSHLEGTRRVELGIPLEVLREAVLNAVAHRDYRAASQTRLFVFDDRVELINPGLLLNHLTLDSIRLGGISQRRNPTIASLLARAELRENIGMGVPEMIRLMTERGLPAPDFDVQGGHFRLTLRLGQTT
jgi:ATP-dependent DNA helicase RecG